MANSKALSQISGTEEDLPAWSPDGTGRKSGRVLGTVEIEVGGAVGH